MSIRVLFLFIAISSLTLGCSDDSTTPEGSAVSASDILAAPIGTVEVNGQVVTMQGSYYAVAEGEPLQVLGALSDPDAEVERMWFVAGWRLERDDDPQECFIPSEACVSHTTGLPYREGIEFVVALDLRDSNGELVRVRSKTIKVEGQPPAALRRQMVRPPDGEE